MKKESVTKADIYKPVWTLNDTILTLYCAKYPHKIGRLGFHSSGSSYSEYDDLANHAIGSTGFSLKRQIGNIEFLMGKNDSQWSVSNIQKKVYDNYNHMTEDELHKVCMEIIENVPPSVYEEFAEKQRVHEGIERAENFKKTREFFKRQSEEQLAADFKRRGLDMSRFKSKGIRPKE